MAKFLFTFLYIIIYMMATSEGEDKLPSNLPPFFGARYNALRAGPEQTGSENPADSSTGSPTLTHPNKCVCSEIYDPQCATNGKSYFNPCLMECELGPNSQVTVEHQGNCIPF